MLLNGEKLVLGTCYYPEHWEESLWAEDLMRMRQVGIQVIRIAEFAWNKVEPQEGVFTFAFWDHFLDICEEQEMKVIFCTPTATPPAWLVTKYPEVLNADINGVLYRHGARRHYNYNAPKYLELSARIVEELAKHYASRSCIIGWQIDNEINCEKDVFYSESDQVAFRTFLLKKYGNLETLNEAWGTVFWNQTYTDFEEIRCPSPTNSGSPNPHLMLDYYRFISESARGFAKMQSDILRKYLKETDFITTNGLFPHLDSHEMTRESLDFITYDSYPDFAYSLWGYDEKDRMKDRNWSKNLSEVRSISKNFGIMEQQSGPNGWNVSMEAPAPRPGQMTLWTMQSVAHGADYISFFRWRTCTFGTEMYWHGILDYSGRDNRRLFEVSGIYEKFLAMQEIAGSRYEAKVAILRDYDNIWDAEIDVWHGRVEKQSVQALFEAAQTTHTPLDFVYMTEDISLEELKKYEVIFYPHATIMTPERVLLLEQYVAEGGTIVFGCRSAYKEITGKCTMERLPGLLRSLTGVDIPEYTFISSDAEEIEIYWEKDTITANCFVDLLEAKGEQAEVVGRYLSDYYAGRGAVVKNMFGKGCSYYFGSAFDFDTAVHFLERLQVAEPYQDLLSIPEGCELAVRVKEGRKYAFLLQYLNEETVITCKQPVRNLYTGETIEGEIVLPAYGTLVVELPNG